MPDSHSFSLPIPPDTYDRVTAALVALNHMAGNEVTIMGARLGLRYDRGTHILTLIILSKPGFVGTGYVEKKVRDWLRVQGVTGA